MKCDDIEQLQHAYIDQELDAANAQAFAKHVATCPHCSAQVDALQSLKRAIKNQTTRHEMPFDLADKITRMTAPSRAKGFSFARGMGGAALALAACLAFFMLAGPNEEYLLEQQLIADHLRSLQEGHLMDVVSTDQHTVKPWFNGKLDVSPPVVDLIANGFPLAGGRLDYADHRSIAALVYRYNAHVINLFVWPSDKTIIDIGSGAVQQGYNMRHWQDSGLQFWAVSDVNAAKLGEFEKLYRDKTKPK